MPKAEVVPPPDSIPAWNSPKKLALPAHGEETVAPLSQIEQPQSPMKKLLLLLFTLASVFSPSNAAERTDRPNVLWFIVDDMSANFSCYGEKLIETPHVDRLAREGTRFTHAFVTAPVCSPCRSALITGMYQTSIGAHHHRSGRGVEKVQLPDGATPIPALFRNAGYFTCMGDGLPGGNAHPNRALGKTDYNFEWDERIYDADVAKSVALMKQWAAEGK